jgi:BirA family biotin operon repressor/biotin-[acetyl-CoA-carboxylase] ligase
MTDFPVTMPGGYRLARFEVIDSTNSEAMRRARNGEPAGLWIWAASQTAGRGRSGRSWESLQGNLFASLLLRPRCPLETAMQLSLVAGVALHETVSELAGQQAPGGELALKWPNDLLLGGEKMGGILLESFEAAPGKGCGVIIGTGLNISGHPSDALYPATDLAAHGPAPTPSVVLEHLAAATKRWLEVWAEGSSFAAIREAWLARSIPIGSSVRIKLETGELFGRYAGIDETGSLRLIDEKGVETRITAGDVFLTS